MIISKVTKDGTPIKDLKPNSERLISVQCEVCDQKRYVKYVSIRKRFQKQKNKKTPCRRCALLHNKFRQGVKPWNKGKSYFEKESHPQWTGGTWISSDGYKMIYTGAKGSSGWAKYQKEHVVLMEKRTGRKLQNEVVHHINGDKLDNTENNLVVIPTNKHHRNTHWSLQLIGFELVKAGFISFDQESLTYVADQKLRELLEQPEVVNQQPSPIREGSETRE